MESAMGEKYDRFAWLDDFKAKQTWRIETFDFDGCPDCDSQNSDDVACMHTGRNSFCLYSITFKLCEKHRIEKNGEIQAMMLEHQKSTHNDDPTPSEWFQNHITPLLKHHSNFHDIYTDIRNFCLSIRETRGIGFMASRSAANNVFGWPIPLHIENYRSLRVCMDEVFGNTVVLDIGCGRGLASFGFNSVGAVCYGIDRISPEDSTFFRWQYPERYLQMDISALNWSEHPLSNKCNLAFVSWGQAAGIESLLDQFLASGCVVVIVGECDGCTFSADYCVSDGDESENVCEIFPIATYNGLNDVLSVSARKNTRGEQVVQRFKKLCGK